MRKSEIFTSQKVVKFSSINRVLICNSFMFGKSPFQMFNLWISKWIWKHYASDATDARVRLNTNASLTPQREHDLLFSLLWFCVLYVYFLVNRFPVSFRLTLVLFLLFRNAFMQINFNILEDGILVEGIMWFFKIFIVNFRCFYFYRRAKIHLAYEKKIYQRVKYEMDVPVGACAWQRCLLL